MKRSRILILALAFILSLLLIQVASPVCSQEKGKITMVTVTGKLIKVVAIGGETTGWAVDLDNPLQAEGEAFTRIEIDPAGKEVNGFENRQIEAMGSLEKQFGIERGGYWVITVENIRKLRP